MQRLGKLRLLSFCLLSTACRVPAATHHTSADPAPQMLRYEGQAMGTSVVFTALVEGDDAEQAATDAFAAAFAELNRIEVLMTTWEHPGWPKSDIMLLNDAAGRKPVPISPDTMAVLQAAQTMAERSDGAFDVTFAAMHGLWKFDEDLEAQVPSEAAIAARLALVNFRDLVLDPAAGTAFLRRPGMVTSLGGIAKGYAVDACVRVLREAGLRDFLVQAGGDLYVAGKRGAQDWQVGIRDPRDPSPDAFFATAPIGDHAFSTAGDYERSFVLDGQRYHHILDPHTGKPATASRSVTIFAPTALLADTLDDAVFILGAQKGLALLEEYPGVEAVIVDADNKVWVSAGLQGTVRILQQPTL